MKWIGQHIVDSIARFRNTVDFSKNVTFYQPVNNADPEISIGASDNERLKIGINYQGTTTQTAQIVNFKTYTASGTANDGLMRFSPDGVPVLDIDDGGINLKTGFGISINGTNILTDSSGTATLSNIDALDATTEATIEATIETRSQYSFRGYASGLASGNFQYSEDMSDAQFPFQLNTDYGNTVIANGNLSDVSTYFRSSGIVATRTCTAIDMVGWASCGGTTNNVTISLCKVTPTRDDATTNPVPIVVATTTFAALNDNDKLENFSGDDEVGAVTIVGDGAIAKGDILMPFVISPYDGNAKTTYFNMTLEVVG